MFLYFYFFFFFIIVIILLITYVRLIDQKRVDFIVEFRIQIIWRLTLSRTTYGLRMMLPRTSRDFSLGNSRYIPRGTLSQRCICIYTRLGLVYTTRVTPSVRSCWFCIIQSAFDWCAYDRYNMRTMRTVLKRLKKKKCFFFLISTYLFYRIVFSLTRDLSDENLN